MVLIFGTLRGNPKVVVVFWVVLILGPALTFGAGFGAYPCGALYDALFVIHVRHNSPPRACALPRASVCPRACRLRFSHVHSHTLAVPLQCVRGCMRACVRQLLRCTQGSRGAVACTVAGSRSGQSIIRLPDTFRAACKAVAGADASPRVLRTALSIAHRKPSGPERSHGRV